MHRRQFTKLRIQSPFVEFLSQIASPLGGKPEAAVLCARRRCGYQVVAMDINIIKFSFGVVLDSPSPV